MKRTTSKALAISIFLVLSLLVFFSCTFGPQTIQLEKPNSIAIEPVSSEMDMQEISSENMQLVTEENPLASGYIFYIYEGVYNSLVTSLDSFVPYESTNNYLSVNDIFVNPTMYYFYSVSKGGKVGKINYTNSEKSELKNYNNNERLARPTVNITNTTLTWSTVANASSYKVYENNVLKATITNNTYDFSAMLNTNRKLLFKVQAIGEVHYSSAYSLEREYSVHLQLATPTSLSLSDSNILTWDSVENASTYQVKINSTEIPSATNAINIGQYLQQVGLYTISVKTNNNVNFVGSEYSSHIEKTIYKALRTPTISACLQNQNLITLTWSSVPNALTYCVKIGEDIEFAYVNSNSCIIDVTKIEDQENNNLNFYVKANAHDYYTDSEYSEGYQRVITRVLGTPTNLNLNNTSKLLTWTAVELANSYEVKVNDTTLTAVSNSLNIATYLSAVDTYDISVKAIGSGIYTDSDYSITINYVNKLQAPVISNVYSDNDNFVVEWNSIAGAIEYLVYVKNNYQDTVALNTVTIAKNEELKTDGYYNIYVIASNGENLVNSDKSNIYKYIGFDNAETPSNVQVNVNGSAATISWPSCANASSYQISVDNEVFDCSTNHYTTTLESNKVYAFSVRSVGVHSDYSDYSTQLIYNNTTYNYAGYSDKYFLYDGIYQDYVITSQRELDDIIKSRFLYRNNESATSVFDIHYVSYDDNSLATNLGLAVQNYGDTHGSFSYSFKSNFGVFNKYKITLSLNNNAFYPLESPLVSAEDNSTTQFNYQSTHYGSGRTNYNDFALDKKVMTQTVNWSDELYYFSEWGIKPTFIPGSTAETVYNTAKEILNSILEEGMTDYQKVLAIHDWICKNIEYDDDTYEAKNNSEGTINNLNFCNARCYYLEGAILDKLAVCDGISKAFSLLCNMEGIECVRVVGEVDDSTSNYGHAWNRVKLAVGGSQKAWYNVDATWDNSGVYDDGNTEEIICYDYFLISDNQNDDHIEDVSQDYPEAITNYNFYQNRVYSNSNTTVDVYITSQNELNSVMLFFSKETERNDFFIKIGFDYGASSSDEINDAKVYCLTNGHSFNFNTYNLGDYIIFYKT